MSNICNCPTPPGGQVVCESHQMAVCLIYNGQARQQCLDPIRTESSTALVNWALSKITGERKASEAPITNQEIDILTQGRHISFDSIVSFSLPQNIKNALQEIINNRGRNRGGERGLNK